MSEQKLCPLTYPSGTRTCMEDRCAWGRDGRCAIILISEGLYRWADETVQSCPEPWAGRVEDRDGR